MLSTDVISLWGQPDEKVTTTTEYGADEMWVFRNKPKVAKAINLYFVKGVLKVWQTVN